MTETAAQELLARLAAQYGQEPYDPTQDITARDAALEWRVSDRVARLALAREAEAGHLKMRFAIVNGCRMKVYRRV